MSAVLPIAYRPPHVLAFICFRRLRRLLRSFLLTFASHMLASACMHVRYALRLPQAPNIFLALSENFELMCVAAALILWRVRYAKTRIIVVMKVLVLVALIIHAKVNILNSISVLHLAIPILSHSTSNSKLKYCHTAHTLTTMAKSSRCDLRQRTN